MTHTGNYSKQPDTSVLLQSARFCTTAATFAQLPSDALAEVAFVGRSNAGKSSAINVLCGQRRLAFASKTPGRTQHINLFDVGLGGVAVGRLADLPGYGFAAVPMETKQRWQRFIAQYLTQREQLAGLVLIADSRLGLTELDWTLLGYAAPAARPVHVLLTKADKLTQAQRAASARKVRDALQQRAAALRLLAPVSVQLFSSTQRLGLVEASRTIEEWLQPPADATNGEAAQ